MMQSYSLVFVMCMRVSCAEVDMDNQGKKASLSTEQTCQGIVSICCCFFLHVCALALITNLQRILIYIIGSQDLLVQ